MKKIILVFLLLLIAFSVFSAPIEIALNKYIGEEIRVYVINYNNAYSEKIGIIIELKDGLLVLEELSKSEKKLYYIDVNYIAGFSVVQKIK